VINDDLLLSLAQSAPDSKKGLEEAGLTKIQVEKFGSQFLKAIRSGQNSPLVVRTRSKRPSDSMLARLERLKQWRKKEAGKTKVESDIILPKTLLYSIAEQGPRDLKKLAIVMNDSPWRFNRYGEEIIKVLESKSKPKEPSPVD
jgi:ribonuclease D